MATYSWNPLSRRTAISYGNGTSLALAYDAAFNDLTGLTHSFAGSSAGFGYTVNKDHQRTGTSLTDNSFVVYPAASASVSYSAGPLNQYSVVNSVNLTGDGTNSFAYDTENRMVSALTPAHTTSYAYDPLGRRFSKTVDGTTTATLSDGAREIAEYSGATLLRRFVYGPNLDEPLVTLSISGGVTTKTWLHQDALGTIIATSTASGTVGDKYAYGPFGETPTLTGSPFRYAGRRLDPETGLYYNRARMYNPALGRFMQTDPIGYTGGLNLYAYVGNDPLNLTDPSGLCVQQVATDVWNQTIIPMGNAVVAGIQELR